eukprot:gnl/TRDRNA2_/TRDRNA2_167586_c0_seq1.p1 gnl/TRDRNA2_/TRDRNA2_167586_c0~~gnl/TRDRNA2_/TRDRNA2_167586_c0_seq1.p1  ORF type:complete len:775 (+),score=146.66 gnl/TRDRNA2_/TRDRNA2_167586_c0_seq1:102-2426(+)
MWRKSASGLEGSVTLCVSGDSTGVPVALAIAASQSELLQGLQRKQQLRGGGGAGDRIDLGKFPGGAPLLRSVVAFLTDAAEAEHASAEAGSDAAPAEGNLSSLTTPPLSGDNLIQYVEAAARISCPSLLRALSRSSSLEELPSRRALLLLEQTLALTADPDEDEGPREPEEPLSNSMLDAFLVLVASVCERLDPRDFRLGPPLAKGTLKASLEVLNAYRQKISAADGAMLESTVRTMSSISRMSTTSESVKGAKAQKIEWTEHQFALFVFRQYLEKETQAAVAAGTARQPPPPRDLTLPGAELDSVGGNEADSMSEAGEEDDELALLGDYGEDVAEDVVDRAPDATLMRIGPLVFHCDAALTPPAVAAVMVRALLLNKREDRADQLFQAVFDRSSKLQQMVVDRQIPVEFLKGVRRQRAASVTLRRMLASYGSTPHEELCDLIESLLFEELNDEKHAHDVIIKHRLTRNLILWMRSGGIPGGERTGAIGFREDGAADADETIQRVRQVGSQLFAIAFVPHGGFLPVGLTSTSDTGAPHAADVTDSSKASECPWDTGALDLPLLAEVPYTEDAVQLSRRVILRSMHQRSRLEDVHAATRHWPLGRWQQCRDPTLIGEAFLFLSSCWRALTSLPGLAEAADNPADGLNGYARPNGSSYEVGDPDGTVLVGEGGRLAAEERIFKMFSDIEIWRLPQEQLLTPWVPAQVLACHVSAQCKRLEDRQCSLVGEARENLDEIGRLQSVVNQLSAKLEATDHRSQQCMQKQADINDYIRQLR